VTVAGVVSAPLSPFRLQRKQSPARGSATACVPYMGRLLRTSRAQRSCQNSRHETCFRSRHRIPPSSEQQGVSAASSRTRAPTLFGGATAARRILSPAVASRKMRSRSAERRSSRAHAPTPAIRRGHVRRAGRRISTSPGSGSTSAAPAGATEHVQCKPPPRRTVNPS
jgi:hypothetical protein